MAISCTSAKRCSSEPGRAVSKKLFSICSWLIPCVFAKSLINVSTPADRVGPGNTEFTVTPVPRVSCAKPLLTDLDAGTARTVQGPATVDGIGPTRGWELYWMEVDVKRRRAAPWAAPVPEEIATKVSRLSAAE